MTVLLFNLIVLVLLNTPVYGNFFGPISSFGNNLNFGNSFGKGLDSIQSKVDGAQSNFSNNVNNVTGQFSAAQNQMNTAQNNFGSDFNNITNQANSAQSNFNNNVNNVTGQFNAAQSQMNTAQNQMDSQVKDMQNGINNGMNNMTQQFIPPGIIPPGAQLPQFNMPYPNTQQAPNTANQGPAQNSYNGYGVPNNQQQYMPTYNYPSPLIQNQMQPNEFNNVYPSMNQQYPQIPYAYLMQNQPYTGQNFYPKQ